jgi:hypothetical protein
LTVLFADVAHRVCRVSYLKEHPDVDEDDDPKWTAIQKKWSILSDPMDEIAWSFCERPPTTINGVRALLAYAIEVEDIRTNCGWPDYWRADLVEALTGIAFDEGAGSQKEIR